MDAAEFETFWLEWPGNRVGKIPAQKEYAKARKTATADEILEGVRLYRAHKPVWQQWAHARTWLHQQRWTDEYDTPTLAAPVIDRNEMDDYHRFRREAIARQKSA